MQRCDVDDIRTARSEPQARSERLLSLFVSDGRLVHVERAAGSAHGESGMEGGKGGLVSRKEGAESDAQTIDRQSAASQ
jgi:hypothetical protein